MKAAFYALFTLVSALTFSAQAAQLVNPEQAAQLESAGVVSVTGLTGSTDDVVRELRKKAREENAGYLRVIGIHTPGDSSRWSGYGEIYR